MIKIVDLNKSYETNKKKIFILKNFNLDVAKGDRLCIVGGSGSGKTTLLKCIAGLINFNSGEIIFENDINLKDNRSKEYLKRVGFVFQNYNLFVNKTVLQNIILPLTSVRQIKKDIAIEQARELLRQLNLADKENAYPNHLSGGQKQRVAIARALAINPSVLLFDEPVASLDPKNASEIVDIIKNKIGNDITIIIVTHSIEFVKEVAKNVAFIYNGKIEEMGPVGSILKKPKSKELKEFLIKKQIKNPLLP